MSQEARNEVTEKGSNLPEPGRKDVSTGLWYDLGTQRGTKQDDTADERLIHRSKYGMLIPNQ